MADAAKVVALPISRRGRPSSSGAGESQPTTGFGWTPGGAPARWLDSCWARESPQIVLTAGSFDSIVHGHVGRQRRHPSVR